MEIESIMWYLGYPNLDDDDPWDFFNLFVAIMDGNYKEMFAHEECVPYLLKYHWIINAQSKAGA